MRTYNKIDIPAYKPFNYVFRLLLSAESVKRGNPYPEGRKPRFGCLLMLFAKNGSRSDERDLLAVRNGFERRSERHFRFAETDVAAKKPVHNLIAFHVGFYLRD